MVRVRFAPSPTGYLHIGGARTALFNYLFARHNKGKFILRIEDTDKERSTKESEQEILDSLKWLGLDWDEGPGKSTDDTMYYQTKRLDVYKKYAEKLLAEGKAYKCYCTKEELDAERKKAETEKRAFKYDGRCGRLNAQQCKENEAAGKPYTVRVRIDQEAETVMNDLIRGEVRVANSTLDDIIILRTDGMPIYNFVVVVDDAEMGITHVIRGDDHLSNTPKQINIYKALGFPIPLFAHIPLILGSDKSKLSKRHGETAVLRYKEMGFLPEALVNYLAMLGWSAEGEDDFFTMDRLIEKFSLERIHKSGAMFDNQKLTWMNANYIRKMDLDKLTQMCGPYLIKSGLVDESTFKSGYDRIKKIVLSQQEKIRTLAELPGMCGYFFTEEVELDADALKTWEKNVENRDAALAVFVAVLKEAGSEDKEKLENLLKLEMEKAGIKPKIYMHVIRVAISGTTIGPGLFEIVEILGTEACLKRADRLRTKA
jgi:nondiscriminating glutamyl-tRNA synthetase